MLIEKTPLAAKTQNSIEESIMMTRYFWKAVQ